MISERSRRLATGLAASALFFPFILSFHPYPTPSLPSEVVAGGLSLLAVVALERRGEEILPDEICGWFLAFAVYSLLCVEFLPFIDYPARGWVGALCLAVVIGTIWAGQVLGRRAIQALALALLLAALANASLSGPAGGFLNQRNHLADLTALALASLLFLFQTKRVGVLLFCLCSLLLLWSGALTASRAFVIYLTALVVLRRDLVTVFWLLTFFVLQLVLTSMDVEVGAERLVATTLAVEATRLDMWTQTFEIWQESPLFGVGLGQLTLGTTEGIADHSHNIFLQLLAETGLLGLSLIVVGLTRWAVSFSRCEKTEEWWWILSILCVLGLHSQWEYPLWYMFFLVPFGLCIGIGASLGHTNS